MDDKQLTLLEKFVPKNYLTQANQALTTHENEIRILIEKCKLPKQGWSEERIKMFLNQLSLMDSNNFTEICGLGEREGRVYSRLVKQRHFNFSHGIGRSGDINEVQPKATGSSIVNRLTNELVLDLIKASGLTFAKDCFIMPMATGMTLAFCMLSMRCMKPNAKYVIMPRIDQKSCIKSIITAGYTPVIIENLLVGEELQTNLKSVEDKIRELKPENVVCIFSTTSCFAPRACDKVEDLAKLCAENDIFHLINNAYGVQSSKCMHVINQASRVGRVDFVVQSTDKNLMVPVGGSIIAAFDETKLKKLSAFYPGRASASQSLDVLITLLTMGLDGYMHLLNERKESFNYLKDELKKFAEKHGEKVLETPNNPISLGLTLTKFGTDRKNVTQIGSMIFTRLVSGVRVISNGDNKEFDGIKMNNFGSHSNDYPYSYLTAAAAIGIDKSNIDVFIKRLEKIFK